MDTTSVLRRPKTAADSTFPIDFINISKKQLEQATLHTIAAQMKFSPVARENMPHIMQILEHSPIRTTDFSFGGILMWVEYFKYEFAVVLDTLFIKGRVESDTSKVAFSMPVGRLPLATGVAILREYCKIHDLPFIFSAVPEDFLPEFNSLKPLKVEPLSDWSDYLYEAETLATLRGKKMSKKRNHVNQFLSAYPDYSFNLITPQDTGEIMAFMDAIDAEGDDTPMAIEERHLNRVMLEYLREADPYILGGVLRDGNGKILAFTMADIMGDTLFIHIEKALREAPGAFEMINKSFAAKMLELHPQLKYINREDDAGDPGLRYAKESYHPCALLKKYNVMFA